MKEEGVSEVVSDMWNLNQLSLPRISQLDDTLIDGWERRRKQTGTVPKNVFGRKDGSPPAVKTRAAVGPVGGEGKTSEEIVSWVTKHPNLRTQSDEGKERER